MSATIRWNRLILSATHDVEFASLLDEFFPRLLELEYDDVECDLSGVSLGAIGPDGKQALSVALSSLGSTDKEVTLRLPDILEPYVKKSGISNIPTIRIDIVKTLKKATPPPREPSPPAGPEVTDASGRLIRSLDDDDQPVKKPSSSFGGGGVPLPGGSDMNRRTLVGLPVDALDDDLPPPTQRDEEGIDELIIGSHAGDIDDLADLPDDSDLITRRPENSPSVDRAWLVEKESGESQEIGNELVIGRAAPATWVFDIPTISKRHTRLFKDKDHYYIEDLKATNGTFLNRRQITGDPILLIDGDMISVAHTLKTPNGARIFTFRTSEPK